VANANLMAHRLSEGQDHTGIFDDATCQQLGLSPDAIEFVAHFAQAPGQGHDKDAA